jgi:hypothetical protein
VGLTGSVQYSQNTTQDNSITLFSQQAGVNYAGDPLKLLEFDYSHGASASLTNVMGDNASQTFSASFSHGLSRGWPDVLGGRGSFSLNEGFGTTQASGAGVSAQSSKVDMSHGANLAWQRSFFGLWTLNAGAHDVRDSLGAYNQKLDSNLIYETNLSRNISLNAFGRGEISRGHTLDGSDYLVQSFDANAQYRDRRFFNIRQLTFFSQADARLRVQEIQPAAQEATESRELTLGWRNQLEYLIGRTTFYARLELLLNRANDQDFTKSGLLYFSLQRALGN